MNISAILSLHAELWLTLILLVALVADLFMGPLRRRWFHPLICVFMCIQVVVNLTPDTRSLFGGMYINTPFTSIVKSVLSAGTLIIFLQSSEWMSRKDTHYKQGEFYVITLATLLGMFFMITAGHFLMFYIGLELASIPMACLVALDKYRHRSAEAGAKFILSSMFSSALLLYGISFIYGTCGTLYFTDLPEFLNGSPLQQFALVLFVAGMGFKMSLVPFHLWTADVYQGAPTSVAAYLSVISKGAAAVAMAVILLHVFAPMKSDWTLLVSILSVATITIGNLMAILQGDLKRFMAFSSISQAGYILLGVLGDGAHGMASLVFYILVYVAANVAVFTVIGTVEQHTGYTDRDDYRGLYRSNPRLTLVLTLALFSLAGIPPFAGFFSKFFIFASAFSGGFRWVVFLALLNTIVSLYYYLLVVKAMYIEVPLTADNTPAVPSLHSRKSVRMALGICVAGICLLGILSFVYEELFRWAEF